MLWLVSSLEHRKQFSFGLFFGWLFYLLMINHNFIFLLPNNSLMRIILLTPLGLWICLDVQDNTDASRNLIYVCVTKLTSWTMHWIAGTVMCCYLILQSQSLFSCAKQSISMQLIPFCNWNLRKKQDSPSVQLFTYILLLLGLKCHWQWCVWFLACGSVWCVTVQADVDITSPPSSNIWLAQISVL